MHASVEILKKDKEEAVSFKKIAIILIFLFIFSIIYKIIKAPFTFLKYKIFKKDIKLKIKSAPEIVNTDKYRLTLHQIDDSYKNYNLAKKFYHNTIDETEDDIDIFVVKSHKFSTTLDELILTDFKHQIENIIFLQEIRFDSKKKVTSYLICYDIITNEVKQIKEIGLFLLDEYEEEKKFISGFNLNTEEDILVHLIL